MSFAELLHGIAIAAQTPYTREENDLLTTSHMRRWCASTIAVLLTIVPTAANAQSKDQAPLGNEEVAYILWGVGGLLIAGGFATAIAGGVASKAKNDDLALAGFVAGGMSMFVAGAAPVAIGVVLYPWNESESAGGSLTLAF